LFENFFSKLQQGQKIENNEIKGRINLLKICSFEAGSGNRTRTISLEGYKL